MYTFSGHFLHSFSEAPGYFPPRYRDGPANMGVTTRQKGRPCHRCVR